MSKYSELLRDPRWQKKRLEVFNRDNFSCQLCMDDKSTLHIHHKKYQKGKKPWEYQNDHLITLCESCHALTKNDNRLPVFEDPIDSFAYYSNAYAYLNDNIETLAHFFEQHKVVPILARNSEVNYLFGKEARKTTREDARWTRLEPYLEAVGKFFRERGKIIGTPEYGQDL